ncbi:MAG: ATP-binding cassette domain-containing protein [Coprobacillaceae bacterium]
MKIDIKNLDLTYPSGKQALKNINISLESPSLIGLLGPNGAGKSSLMKLLVAALLPTNGEILMNGSPLKDCEKEMKSKSGYLPQSFGLYDELTVTQFLDYMAALKGIKNIKESIERVLEATYLQEKRKAPIHTLSGGQ